MLRVIKTGSGTSAPVFVCDHCKQRIENSGLALCTWKEIKTRQPTEESENEYAIFLKQQASLVEQGELYILHKVCADQFEMAHGGNEYRWPWLEFIDLLFFLTSNSGITFEDLQRVEVEREEMGW